MTVVLLNKRWCLIALVHSVCTLAAFEAAGLLSVGFARPPLLELLSVAPGLIAVRLFATTIFGLHHDRWRYTGIPELERLLKAVVLGSLLYLILTRLASGQFAFPPSVVVLEGVLTLLFLSGPRIGVRMLVRARQLRSSRTRVPVVLVGAGAAAALLLRELEKTNYTAVGLVDDDPKKFQTRLCGVPVVGLVDDLPRLVNKLAAREILIAIPSATAAQILRITDFCQQANVPFRTLPGLTALIGGKVSLAELRDVNLEDLLGRDPVRLNSENIRAQLDGRVVMVTGAAGSIGSELCRQIVTHRPRRLICVDQAETPLFNLQCAFESIEIETVYSVTDITDTERMRYLLLEHGVQVVFHAAAYKHVPLTEQNLYEVLKTNVFGLLDLVEVAQESGCEDFVLISSDKAVNPSSFMGCTKRLGELIVASRHRWSMRCASVRFGNVLGSQGSVIPIFQEQIRTRRCITVTHPDMTRYFMTIPEAVSLVLQAFVVGQHGNILVLDMGEPVRILDLARTLIRMSGRTEQEICIVFSGVRPGEKLFEELFYDSEVRLPTSVSQILCAQTALPDWSALHSQLVELETVSKNGFGDAIRATVKRIIPEYQWTQATESSCVASIGPSPSREQRAGV
jgi:FlaA1/EpsC-like NDP-sugar epimerase